MSDWHPIATAPRDGTPIILWSPDAEPDTPFLGHWRDDPDLPDGGAWWERADDAYPIDADATHWMPLPAAPRVGRQP